MFVIFSGISIGMFVSPSTPADSISSIRRPAITSIAIIRALGRDRRMRVLASSFSRIRLIGKGIISRQMIQYAQYSKIRGL